MTTSSRGSPNRSVWTRLRHTPLTDLLHGRVSGSLDMWAAIADSQLPAPLADLTYRTARRTRLGRAERVDVARQLAEQFRDRLSAGDSAEQLAESFGDPRQVAHSIGETRLLTHPLHRRALRWGFRAGAFLLLICLSLAARFLKAHPDVEHDYRADLEAALARVPEADRGWPMYRQAIAQSGPEPKITIVNPPSPDAPADWGGPGVDPQAEPIDASRQRPGTEHWPRVLEWLSANQQAIEATRQGAARPRLGFVYGDPADKAWLEGLGYNEGDWHGSLCLDFYLPHINAMRELWQILRIDARAALAAGDSKRFIDDVRAIVGMAEQVHADVPLLLVDLVSLAGLRTALEAVRDALTDDPGVLGDDDLRQLASLLTGFAGGQFVMRVEGERLAFYDFIQRAYSDDGEGDGILTLDGVKLLRNTRWSGTTLADGRHPARELPPVVLTDPHLPIWVASATGTLMVVNRRKITQAADEIFGSAEVDCRRPLWEWHKQSFRRQIGRWMRSSIDRLRYAPVVAVVPEIENGYAACQIVTQERDAVLVALALELFHRRHDAWPQRLDELVPDFLPAVPLDRITGEPLRYRLIDDEPTVYSMGIDRKDDAGRAPDDQYAMSGAIVTYCRDPEAPPESEIVGRDWVLWPPPEPTNP